MILTELYSFLVQTLTCSFVTSFILIVWYDTNAVVEYGKLLSFRFKDYKYQEELGISYVDYLAATYSDYFIIRLICCPICLCVWLSIAFALMYENVYIVFSVFYLSLVMYFLFKNLMKKSDEQED